MTHRSPEDILIERERILAERMANDPVHQLDLELAQARAEQARKDDLARREEYVNKAKIVQGEKSELNHAAMQVLDAFLNLAAKSESYLAQAEDAYAAGQELRQYAEQYGFVMPEKVEKELFGLGSSTLQTLLINLTVRAVERLPYLRDPKTDKNACMRSPFWPRRNVGEIQ